MDDFTLLPTPILSHPAAMTRRDHVRARINAIADPQSREGVMADALAAIVIELARLTGALAQAAKLSDVAAAAKPFAEISAAFIGAVQSGAISMPYQGKAGGAVGALEALGRLSSAVSSILVDPPPVRQE